MDQTTPTAIAAHLLKQALDAAEIGTAQYSVPLDQWHGSTAVQQLYGVSVPAEAIATLADFLALVHLDDRASVRQAIAVAIDRGSTYHYECRTAARSHCWLRHQGIVIRDATGQAQQLIEVVTDVSDRVIAQTMYQRLHDRQQALWRHSQELAIQADSEGQMTFVSAAITSLLGHPEQDWLSQPLAAWIHPQDQSVLAAVWECGGPIDLRVRHQEARWVWMRMQIHRTLIATQPVWIVNAQDITQQRNMRSSLQETAEQVQILVDNFPGAFYRSVAGQQWQQRFVSQGFEQLSGQALPAIDHLLMAFPTGENSTYSDLILPEDLLRCDQQLQAAIANHAPFVLQYRIRGADGIHWIEERGRGVLNAAGELEWIDGVLLNVTDRVAAEMALREREERLSQIYNHAPIGIAFADGQTDRYLEVNAAFCQLLGYAPDELHQHTWMDLTHPDDLEDELLLHQQCQQRQRQSYLLEKRYLHKDGHAVWARIIVNWVVDLDTQRSGSLVLVEDRTEYSQAQQQLFNARQRIVQHINNSPLAVIEWTADFRVQQWSDRAQTLFGWSAAEVMGKHPLEWQMIVPADLPQVQRVINQLKEGTVSFNTCCNRNYTKSGSIIECEWHNSVLFDSQRQVISILSLVMDVTVRNQASAELARSRSLLETTLEATADGLLVLSRSGEILYCNQRFMELWQVPAEILAQRTDQHLLLFQQSQLKNPQDFLRQIGSEYAFPDLDCHGEVQLQDGRVFERFSKPHLLAGEIIGRVVSYRDITPD